jgi:methylenetetrahydrofolate reductase (NADPH)
LCAIIAWVAMTELRSATASPTAAVPLEDRYEILPFGNSEQQAAELGEHLRLTVTTSPRHGVDRSLDRCVRLRALGHDVTLHLAARMVRSESHAVELLERAADAGIDDLFVIGGDAPEPLGPYTSAGELLDLIAAHPSRPARLGVAGYPEGHPLISQAELDATLEHKAGVADYLTTQLCFDATTLLRWLEGVRARGVGLPLYVGAVGPVERMRLLEISTKIGVGPSLRFLQKQRGLAALFRSPTHTATKFYDDAAPLVIAGALGIAGFHFFTFNDLLGTRRWVAARRERHG